MQRQAGDKRKQQRQETFTVLPMRILAEDPSESEA